MINQTDTIFAIATPPGKSGVAVIRVSGKQSQLILTSLSRKPCPKANIFTLSKIYEKDSDELIDLALIVYFKAPNSFTGEDVVEFHVHGSQAILNSLISSLAKFENTRIALAGEFSKRAFYNEKMDLTQAEGLADLIDAETKIQQRLALRQMQGELKNHYELWRKQLIYVLALLEAYIDFPDEDIPDNVTIEIENIVKELIQSMKQHLSSKNNAERIRTGIYATIIGAVNAGKSSLINMLVNREVAIVSNQAGTTRDIIEAHLDLDGYPLTIADTAGIRESNDKIEQMGIAKALEKTENADLKIILLDASDPKTWAQSLKLNDQNSLIVLNKIDVDDNVHHDSLLKEYSVIPISIAQEINIDLFLDTLKAKLAELLHISNDPMITRARYRSQIIESMKNLQQFSLDNEIELACEDLRLAARSIAQITGNIDVENILDKIFSNFCIGK